MILQGKARAEGYDSGKGLSVGSLGLGTVGLWMVIEEWARITQLLGLGDSLGEEWSR